MSEEVVEVTVNDPVSPVTVLIDPVVSVDVSGEAIEVNVSMSEIVIPVSVNVGANGLPGTPGAGAEIEIYTALVDIGGHRAVAIDGSGELIYASSDLQIPAVGIVRDAVMSGNEVAVYRGGRVGGFTGLVPGSVYYLSTTGLLSLTPPSSGILQPLGTAASATEFLVDPDYPTFL